MNEEKKTKAQEPFNLRAEFIAVQAEMRAVQKDRENPFFRSNYATLLAIVTMLKPILAKHGLAYTQTVENGNMVTRIFGDGDGQIESSIPFACDSKDPQKVGSYVSYLRRYSLSAAFGVVVAEDETDDDGNKASGKVSKDEEPSPF
jgi:hypothetical protein